MGIQEERFANEMRHIRSLVSSLEAQLENRSRDMVLARERAEAEATERADCQDRVEQLEDASVSLRLGELRAVMRVAILEERIGGGADRGDAGEAHSIRADNVTLGFLSAVSTSGHSCLQLCHERAEELLDSLSVDELGARVDRGPAQGDCVIPDSVSSLVSRHAELEASTPYAASRLDVIVLAIFQMTIAFIFVCWATGGLSQRFKQRVVPPRRKRNGLSGRLRTLQEQAQFFFIGDGGVAATPPATPAHHTRGNHLEYALSPSGLSLQRRAMDPDEERWLTPAGGEGGFQSNDESSPVHTDERSCPSFCDSQEAELSSSSRPRTCPGRQSRSEEQENERSDADSDKSANSDDRQSRKPDLSGLRSGLVSTVVQDLEGRLHRASSATSKDFPEIERGTLTRRRASFPAEGIREDTRPPSWKPLDLAVLRAGRVVAVVSDLEGRLRRTNPLESDVGYITKDMVEKREGRRRSRRRANRAVSTSEEKLDPRPARATPELDESVEDATLSFEKDEKQVCIVAH